MFEGISVSSHKKYRVGDVVEVSAYYASSMDTEEKAVCPGSYVKATITRIAAGKVNNPYLLNEGAVGWCNENDIRSVNGRVVNW